MPVRAPSLCAPFNGALLALALALGIGCGASEATVRERTAAPASALADAGAASEAADAKRLIEAQVYAHADAVEKCLVDFLVKNKMGGGETADFTIDQEGTFVGVVVWCPKKVDGKDPELGAPFEPRASPELNACMTIALHDAMFPKHRLGIITVRQMSDGF